MIYTMKYPSNIPWNPIKNHYKAIGHLQTAARQLRTLPDLSGAATNPLSILDTLEKNEKHIFLVG